MIKKETAFEKCAISASAALLAASAFMMPMMASADATPSVEGTSSEGTTDLVVKLADSAERGGTSAQGQYANPDSDHDGLGDNIAFKVPTKINYTVKADGSLTAPSASEVYLENFSNYPIHASSLQARATVTDGNAAETWAFVSDYTNTSTDNAVQLNIVPNDGTSISAHSYTNKTPLPSTSLSDWNMTAGTETSGVVSDRVQMEMTGGINNVKADITAASGAKFGDLIWYVTPGQAS